MKNKFKTYLAKYLLFLLLGKKIKYEVTPQTVVFRNENGEVIKRNIKKHFCVRLYRKGTYLGKVFVVEGTEKSFTGNYLGTD